MLAGLVRRGEDFDAAEDALQEALLEALRVWPGHPPRDPRAWLATVATRRLFDARRSEVTRHRREEATFAGRRPAATEEGDDTLFLLFCRRHLAPASQVALTLRAVGGLTTLGEIADAFYVPEATMAQRISRAKRALQGRRLDQPGDLAVVLRVLYLVYTAGHAGRVDLAREAIRLARQLTLVGDRGTGGARARRRMLLNHARLPARLDPEGRIVTLDRQDRGQWDAREIAEGVRVLQSALTMQTEKRRPGRYQVEAAIAALHDDAATAEETDWLQILAWYDDLVALTVRIGAPGPRRGARPRGRGWPRPRRRRRAARDRPAARGARWSAPLARRPRPPVRAQRRPSCRRHGVRQAARRATNVAERDHLVRRAARARAGEL